jgi:hypothetical protein
MFTSIHEMTLEQAQALRPYENFGNHFVTLPIGASGLSNSVFMFRTRAEALDFIESLIVKIESRMASQAADSIMQELTLESEV